MTPPPHAASPLYLSAPTVAQWIEQQGIATCLRGLCERLQLDYLRWNEFDKCARVPSHSPWGVIELMPIADAQHYSFKYVNGHPGNTLQGLSTVMAFGVLADMATGAPLLLSELTLTTALRTAAMSALAARTLARPESRVMALIGNGAQSDFQALAFQHLLGIQALRLYDTDPAATCKLVHNLRHSGLELTVCQSTREAVQGADIVTTVTADKCQATILSADMLSPGQHINAVGGDCPGKTELAADVLLNNPVFVEYTPQTRVEGDIQQMPADFPVTELWQVLAGQAPGRCDAQTITVFDSVGFALEDFSALRYLYDSALALGLGERLDLIPALNDPKNLLGCLGAQAFATTQPPVQPALRRAA
ncbi:ornithine cyclodeaminase [Curvibacter sp. HBC28]|uniref:Ornithine cyclodeaminase n=1 Tax=Curvibacter microcysteis TaxID=3026419 RepID=A0ABT5MGT4_9BURK|nr:ornithine cyclodeaminase [Curvibacter sp. HBC28]MDD0815783.1 ornithine cyclodeaminase [Curvibacter sp. HBC28]